MTTAVVPDQKSRSYLITLFVGSSLICGAYFLSNAFVAKEYKDNIGTWLTNFNTQTNVTNPCKAQANYTTRSDSLDPCKDRCRPLGSEPLPKGIVVEKSNLDMRPLWGFPEDEMKEQTYTHEHTGRGRLRSRG